MNTVRLKGVINNIQESHTINNIEFNKANLIVERDDGTSDILNIRFKRYSNPYSEGSEVSLSGNIRSYSTRLDNGKNKVELYIFTYFDQPDLTPTDEEYINYLELDGRICKVNSVRTLKGEKSIHFILANNILVNDGAKKLNSYIPCVATGAVAERLAELDINAYIELVGAVHSREYKKKFDDGTFEFRVAHEVVIEDFVQHDI